MRHYASVLGGEIDDDQIFRNGDAPDAASRMPGGDEMIMNMSMRLGNATIMASDNSEDMYCKPQGFRISLAADSLEHFERIYAGLAERAEAVEMAPDKTFWAERFAMFTDRYGTPWMLNYAGAKTA